MNPIIILNKIGIYGLYCLLIMVPHHFYFSTITAFVYYREFMAVFFLALLFMHLAYERFIDYRIRKEIFYLLLFPVLLCVAAIYDPLINLYQESYGLETMISSVSMQIDPRVYILRNAILYLPLVLYFSNRGISNQELKDLASISVLVAPFSIVFYLLSVYEQGNFSLFLLGEMAEQGGANIQYNSYVPYLTFPFISAIYLLSLRDSKVLKVLSLASISIMAVFIFLSSSRQSMLLIILASFLFALYDGSGKLKKLFIYSSSALLILLTFYYLTSDYELDEALINKYQSGAETSRILILVNGFKLLKLHEFLTGAGLSSVLVSGPHNDYLRWTQRVGFVLMVISFLPYFIGIFRCGLRVLKEKIKIHYIYLSLLLFFLLYHSIFGYPREDAYQSLFSFLGLALWLGYQKSEDLTLKT
jgi:hypothetical protein